MRRYPACLLGLVAAVAWAQDAQEIVRRSITLDQLDWVRMKDYTWQAQSLERHFDARGNVESKKQEGWETLVLDGEPFRRILERDGKPLSPGEQQSEQRKLDRETAKLSRETPAEKQQRVEENVKERKKEFAFLSEIPDLYDLHQEPDQTIDGRAMWVVSGSPRANAQPKSRDARMLMKARGRVWIDKATYKWVKVEAETTATISWGLFLARLNPGAKLVFEQTEINSEVWLPKRLFIAGSGRIGLVKRLSEDQEIRWSNYKKFSVESRMISGQ